MSFTETFPNISRLDGLSMTASTARITDITPSSSNGHTNGKSKPRALSVQIGGEHYKDMAIQPAEYIMANRLGWAEGCAIAYISRWQQKGGVEDLKKAIHTLELLIEVSTTADKGAM